MKSLLVVLLAVVVLSPGVVSAQSPAAAPKPGACSSCGAATTATPQGQAKTIPGTNETIAVGKVENLVPIGVLTVLGCEKCAAEAVSWALQQGSSFDDVERALRTVAAMQKLDCFKAQFGADVNARMEKPLAAAWDALAQARAHAAR